MKRFIPIILMLSILLSSCGALGAAAPAADATATMSVEDIRATADVLVYEMLTQTAAAMPTNTSVPPTETPLPPTATIPPTATLAPTLVEDTAAVTEAAPTAAVIPTNTMVTSSSSTFPCTEKPLTSWDVGSATVHVTNNTPDSTQAYVFFCITTIDGQAGYITIYNGSSAQIPFGEVTATAWVSGKKNFNSTTFFQVKNSDGLRAVIENGQLYIRSSCYPGC